MNNQRQKKEEQKAAKRFQQQKLKTRKMIIVALFVAIIFILTFTPIGFIQLPLIKATIIHIPVIIGAILLGPEIGAFLGFVFGLASFISNTFFGSSILSFAFTPVINVPGQTSGSALSLLVCFVPRILVGIVPYYVYTGLQKLFRHNKVAEYFSLAVSGIAGAVTNTGLVMGFIYLFFKHAFALKKGIATREVAGTVMGIIAANGVPEAIAAAVLTAALCKVLLQLTRKSKLLG